MSILQVVEAIAVGGIQEVRLEDVLGHCHEQEEAGAVAGSGGKVDEAWFW